MAQTDFDTVVLQGTTYLIPKSDANPAWGEQLNDYLKALGNAFGTLVGPSDIGESAANIINNQSSPTAVLGLSFDSGTVRAAFVKYSVYRTTTSTTHAEAGQLTMLYDATASIGSKWRVVREAEGDGGVEFSVSDAGVISYTSDNMAGSSYVGLMKFSATALLQS